jgi:hypothetical protein
MEGVSLQIITADTEFFSDNIGLYASVVAERRATADTHYEAACQELA